MRMIYMQSTALLEVASRCLVDVCMHRP